MSGNDSATAAGGAADKQEDQSPAAIAMRKLSAGVLPACCHFPMAMCPCCCLEIVLASCSTGHPQTALAEFLRH
jgi:hypothetical protein